MSTLNYFIETLKSDHFLFVAEISNNHLGDFDRYKKLVREAKLAGAHAVKIQTFSAESLCLQAQSNNHRIQSGLWNGSTYWDLYKSLEVPLDWSLRIRDYAYQIGIPLFSSPFSRNDVQYLVHHDFDFFKLASAEISSPEIISAFIDSGSYFMASSGFAGKEELDWFHQFLKAHQSEHLLWCLLNCISEYPCNVSQLDASKFSLLSNYTSLVGLSDHSLTSDISIISFLLGARVFEKHFTLSRSDGGPDAAFSLQPSELSSHIDSLTNIANNSSLANVDCVSRFIEDYSFSPTLQFSRSVYAKKNILVGEAFTLDNIGTFRPSHVESGKSLLQLLGSYSNTHLSVGDPVLLAHSVKE